MITDKLLRFPELPRLGGVYNRAVILNEIIMNERYFTWFSARSWLFIGWLGITVIQNGWEWSRVVATPTLIVVYSTVNTTLLSSVELHR